jgi:transketolase
LQNVKKIDGPTLVHMLTTKGKGYAPAESDPVKYHAVTPFHVLTGKAKKEKGPIPTYTDIFAQALIRLAKENPRVVGITAAMGSGTGIDKLSREIPGRSYDVGIAEQHAVTFAAGMATEGLSRWWPSTPHSCSAVTIKFFMTFAYRTCTSCSLWTAVAWWGRTVPLITVSLIFLTCDRSRTL